MHTPLSAIHHFSNHDISINMAPIDDALAALETQEHPNYKDTAKKFGVDRSRLSRRHRGITTSREEAAKDKRLLSK
jgi:hypothetical protein